MPTKGGEYFQNYAKQPFDEGVLKCEKLNSFQKPDAHKVVSERYKLKEVRSLCLELRTNFRKFSVNINNNQ